MNSVEAAQLEYDRAKEAYDKMVQANDPRMSRQLRRMNRAEAELKSLVAQQARDEKRRAEGKHESYCPSNAALLAIASAFGATGFMRGSGR